MLDPALLRPILENPLDDRPRLSAADALEKRGDPRAELIRVQVRRAELERTETDGAELSELVGREVALLGRLSSTLDSNIRARVSDIGWGRGFVQYVRADAGNFIVQEDALRAMAPILEVGLTRAELHLDVLFGTAILAPFKALDLSGSHVGDAGAAAIAGSPHLSGLTWLDLRGNGVTRAGLAALCQSRTLPSLRWLYVDGVDFEPPNDQPVDEDGRLIDWITTELGDELEAAHGPLAWLHYRPRRLRFFPPRRSRFF